MGKIHILSESLRNQIAAGEVVERPASIVKELVENALDAEATQIDIEIEGGGIQKILIRDNGKGMDQEDALMALKRYATSKIAVSDDLFSISTFGFRGEALASIASVSQLQLTTREKSAEHGIRIHGEHSGEIREVSSPTGTEILVEELFYSVPARRKFLKSEATENSHNILIIENIALANPEVGFRMKSEKKTVLDLPSQNSEDKYFLRIQSIFGKEFSENLFPVQYLGETISLHGFVSHPHVHRRNRKTQRIFVNSRPISDRMIFAAISEAYKSLVPHGLYPDVFLFLEVLPELVDVNVHPRKSEVKFLREREVFSAVKGAVEQALKSSESKSKSAETPNFSRPIPHFSSPTNFSRKQTFPSSQNTKPSSDQIQAAMEFSKNFLGERKGSSQDSGFSTQLSDSASVHPKQGVRIVSQIRNSFILIEEDDGLIIVDQHAAHERIRYEKLMKDLREKTPHSQKFLVPQILEISRSEKALLDSEKEIFALLGFEIQDFSENEIAIFSVPQGTETVDFRENLKNLLHDLESSEPESGKAVSSAAERIATFAACRGAVKFGDSLTVSEMEKLIDGLEKCDAFYSCAHGRPIAMKISFVEMERRCGR